MCSDFEDAIAPQWLLDRLHAYELEDEDGMTLLHRACASLVDNPNSKNAENILSTLIKRRFALYRTDREGNVPLCYLFYSKLRDN